MTTKTDNNADDIHEPALLVAQFIDALVHAELQDPFEIDLARLYAMPENENEDWQIALEANPYELMFNNPRPPATKAACLVVTGWAAPIEGAPNYDVAPTSRPSQHPKRQRVRVCIAICEGKIATVMRSSDQPDEVKNMSERGMGGIPDVLEAWWDGLSG
jgi:hypothetical protein